MDEALGDTEVVDELGHPSRAQLASYAWGGTAVGVDLADHLAACARCRDVVASSRALATRPGAGTAVRDALAAGTMVGRYQILEPLGQGGMGIVYRAIDVELDRPVALKLVHARSGTAIEELTERLRRESRLQARAAHPAVIQVHDIGGDGDRVYVAMELAQGGTLRSWVTREPRRWREIVDVFARAAEGLAAAHAAGLVHRDFKPDNVLVEERDGRVTRVLVTDFGVARVVEAVEQASSILPVDIELTITGALVGTPAYMAPEQLHANPVDARTDVFAFGVSLWEALYGERPYRGSSVGELVGAMREPVRAPPRRHERVPGWLERVARKAIAVDPEARHATMAELVRELDWRRRRRTRRVLGLAGVVTVAAAVAVVAIARDRPSAVAASACDSSAPVQLVVGASEALRMAGVASEVEPYRAAWVDALERYLHDTDELRLRTCNAAPPPPDREDRVRCIDGGVRELALQVGLAAHGDRERLGRFLRTRVPAAPHECAAGKPGVAAALVALRSDARPVAEARLLLLDGRVDEAARLAATSGFAPLQQELAVARARLAGDVERMRDAAVAADRAGHVLAAAGLWLVISVDEAEADGKRARDVLAQTELALDRAGNPLVARATWLAAKAYVAAMTDAAATDRFVDEAERLLARLPFDALTYSRLGAAEIRAGHFERGAALHRRAYEAVARLADDDPTVRFVRIAYAGSLNAIGQPDAGRQLLEPLLRGAVASERDLQAAAALATAYSQLGRDTEILALVERYRALADAGVGRSGPALRLLTLEASAAYSLGQLERAHGACRTTLDHHLTALGPDAYDTGDVRVLCGQIEIELGRLDEGRRAIEQGLATLVKTAGAADPLALEGRLALGDVLLRQHRDADALRELEATVEPYRAIAPPEGAAKAELLLARALAATRRDLPRARALVEHAIHAWSADPATWRRQLAEARALAKRLGRTSE